LIAHLSSKDVGNTDDNRAPTPAFGKDRPSKQPAQHEHPFSSKSWLHSRFDQEIFQLALPAALALAADPLLGMVDTALVGKLGADELVSRSLFQLGCSCCFTAQSVSTAL